MCYLCYLNSARSVAYRYVSECLVRHFKKSRHGDSVRNLDTSTGSVKLIFYDIKFNIILNFMIVYI